MSLRLRKSFSPIPGVRITLSPRGVSTSVGAGPFRFTVGPKGSAVTTRLPGSGISYRHRLGAGYKHPTAPGRKGGAPINLDDSPDHTPAYPEYDTDTQGIAEIASEGTGLLTTAGLQDLLEIMQRSKQQNAEIQRELEHAEKQQTSLRRKVTGWSEGFFLKKIRKQTFTRMKEESADADVVIAELKEMQRQSALQVDIDAPAPVMSSFHKMRDCFAVLSESGMIWDTTGARTANKVAERTAASRIVNRTPVKFSLSECPLIGSTMRVPHLENANGGDIYIYPNFAIYFVSKDAFALLEIDALKLSVEPTTFIEDGPIPESSDIVGHAWHKANKDGSPDRRFAGNYQIPIVVYAKVALQSKTGLDEEYLISHAGAGMVFFDAWQQFANCVDSVAD